MSGARPSPSTRGGGRRKVDLLFIHGVGGHGRKHQWTAALNDALIRAERPPLTIEPISPDYSWILSTDGDGDEPPDIATTYRRPDQADLEMARYEYARRAAGLRRLAERWPYVARVGLPDGPELLRSAGVGLVTPANTYVRDEARRRTVLATFVQHLDGVEDLVVVAHSLGSVVALDLLYLLPAGTRLRMLMTAGSPLGIKAVSTHLKRIDNGFPYGRVESWVNLVDPTDPVTDGRGLAHRFPECLDVFVRSDQLNRHASDAYLRRPVAGELLGDVLYGSRSTELVPLATLPDVPPTKEQLIFLLRLHYAKRLELAVNDDERRRRTGAARDVLLDAVERALGDTGRSAPADGSSPVPPIMRDLRRDLGERLRGRFSDHDALPLLLLLAMSRPLDPYDIAFDEDERRIALRNVLDDLELKADWADRVLEAVRDAESAHTRGGSTAKKVVGGSAVALGLAAVVAAPFLIAPFAAAGATGAAAMTSGLAGVGALVNGGMGAGIVALTSVAAAGGVVAAGGTVLALDGAKSDPDETLLTTSARLIASATVAELTATVVQVQALAVLRRRLELSDSQHLEWFLLAEVQSAVAEQRSHICLLSDPSSPTTKQWKQKQRVIDRSLDWMRDQSLAPPELQAASSDSPGEEPGAVKRFQQRVRRNRQN